MKLASMIVLFLTLLLSYALGDDDDPLIYAGFLAVIYYLDDILNSLRSRK